MKNILIHPALYVKEVEEKGWGVFPSVDLSAGTLIERSPVLVLDEQESALANKTALHDYLFSWKEGGRARTAVAWGYLSLYNHSPESNCAYAMEYRLGTLRIETLRPIPAHTELTVNYNGDFDDPSPVWFPLAEPE